MCALHLYAEEHLCTCAGPELAWAAPALTWDELEPAVSDLLRLKREEEEEEVSGGVKKGKHGMLSCCPCWKRLPDGDDEAVDERRHGKKMSILSSPAAFIEEVHID